jgi:hypothetical protein
MGLFFLKCFNLLGHFIQHFDFPIDQTGKPFVDSYYTIIGHGIDKTTQTFIGFCQTTKELSVFGIISKVFFNTFAVELY